MKERPAIAEHSEMSDDSLLAEVQHRTAAALATGALQPIPTEFTILESEGVQFLVRIVANLVAKEQAAQKQKAAAQQGKPANPFLPYEAELFVRHLSPTHVCLLNKFNVVDHHILMVTRHYESQDTWLNASDFEALALCLAEIDGLGFYNGGRQAGASQHHKHLQLIPLPFAPMMARLPLATVVEPHLQGDRVIEVAALPFQHRVRSLQFDPRHLSTTVEELLNAYRAVMTSLGLSLDDPAPRHPYNLLVTRRWMFAVLRSRESHHNIPVNALGYAGSLLVKNQTGLTHLTQLGPMKLLQAVGVDR